MEVATIPVIAKLTPNITNITAAARAAKRGGANAISLINTINSITQVNLDTFVPEPFVGGRSSHGGYCGPAVKPIALNMVQSCASDPEVGLPISGIGGITTWRDAAEFIALGSTNVQVCTAVMHYGFRIVEDLIDGLNDYLDSKGFKSLGDLRGRAVDTVQRWETLDLNYKRIAEIDYGKCIGCNLCYIACEDGAHQAIALADPAGHGLGPGRVPGKPVPEIKEEECVGCNLCSLVCPVEGCITMVSVETGRAAPALVGLSNPPRRRRRYCLSSASMKSYGHKQTAKAVPSLSVANGEKLSQPRNLASLQSFARRSHRRSPDVRR